MQQNKYIEHAIPYEGWKLFEDKINQQCTAEKSLGGNKICRVVLNAHREISYEGYWPGRPQKPPQILITGSCIYSDCWRLQFEPYIPGISPPRPFILGLTHDRKRIHQYLTRKRRLIRHIDVPLQSCVYQDKLLSWQVNCVSEFPDVERLFYRLPVSIHHTFIDEIEEALSTRLPVLHKLLDEYTGMLKNKTS
uniref:Uncharacterized protein n=1 Tax=Candidatus Kentrum sp. LFY TaxID=2126342 RepID=A0A450WAD6_9GAMM|nr:MAG: hypothetical protein BECKLFY1418C_GA0070996_100525 [Candidatus Kentron sp. LFY]